MKQIFRFAILDCRDVLIATMAALGTLDILGRLSIGPF